MCGCLRVRSSTLIISTILYTPVAQWTERKFAELEVAGSIPARGAIMRRGGAWCA